MTRSEISLECIKNALRRCVDCKFNRHGCVRNEAHASGIGCRGFTDATGIDIQEMQSAPHELNYKVALICDRDTIEVLVRKDRKPGCAIWNAAIVRLAAHNSVPSRCARLYGQVLARASEVAGFLDSELD